MWLWRKLEKIKWQDKISNDEVLTTVNDSRYLITTIGERKKNWIGHVLRGRTAERCAGGKNVGKKTARQTKDGNDRRSKGNNYEDNKKKKESFERMK